MTDSIIIDDFLLTQHEIDEIKSLLFGELPWYLGTGTSSTVLGENYDIFKNNENVFEYGQLTHKFVDDGTIFSKDFQIPLMIAQKAIKKYNLPDKLIRLKSNLMTKVSAYGENIHNTPHVDDDIPHWVIIYYVNNSDGDTFIFNETDIKSTEITVQKRISPKEGRIIIFDGKYLHTGMHPRQHDYRSVINFNLIK